MSPSTPRLFALAIAALALAGCANTGGANLFGNTTVKPKTVLVTDFTAAPDVDAIDRGYSLRMDRNGSNFPILERKRRTLARINDEIVATIVVTLREAGLDAQPGSEEALSLNDQAAVVSGRLHGGGQGGAKAKPIGFGAGRDGVVADITISLFSGGARKPLTGFSVDPKDAGKPPAGKQAAERNAAIAAVLVTEKAEVKLSPDVEAQARRLGRAAGEKVAAYAREQGWIAAPEVAEAPEEPVKLPEPKPAPKPAKKKADKPAT
jgi:hypothetical protein